MPPRFVPTKLSDWPWVVVRVECSYCRRRGCYRLARLAAKYGPEQSLTGLLADLAHDCPWWRSNPRKYEPRCAACFVDLERNYPPADHPDEPVYRQRQPGREDLPKLRTNDRLPATSDGGGPTLSGWSSHAISYHCQRCPRRRVFDKASLLAKHGDVLLTTLLGLISADCPRRGSTQVYELCGAMFIMPGQRFTDP